MNDTSAIPKDAFFSANESAISHNATLGVPQLAFRGGHKDIQGDITPCKLFYWLALLCFSGMKDMTQERLAQETCLSIQQLPDEVRC